jgi:hypothetical protein
LSARSFQVWRDQLPEKRDQVTDENQAYRIETSTNASDLRQASVILRKADLRPVEERLEFSNHDWVEITEVAGDESPAPPAIANANARTASSPRLPASEPPSSGVNAPVPSASAADELQVVAALHDVGADLGDPVEVYRSPSEIVVSGLGIAPARQQEIKNAIGSRPHVVVRFSDSPPAPSPDQLAAPSDAPAAGDVRQLQARLAEQLGGRANLDQLAAEVIDSSESLMARAYALRRLAEQFPSASEEELSVTGKGLLKRLRDEHSAALRQRAVEIDRLLRPVLSTVSPAAQLPPDNGIPPKPWQAATEELFQSARRLDKLLGVMFGAAPSETSSGQLPAQLKAGLAELHARLDIYERSNK